jgi:RimJ/RimL family protein N-acetyltransferase
VEEIMIGASLFCGALIRLSALKVEDLPTLAGWYEDAEFLRLYDSRPAYPKTESELGKWLEEVAKDKNTFVFAVRPLNGNDLLGYLELDGVDWQHGVCGMGLGFGERANWGKGYGYEATRLALGYAFDELNLHRVQVTVFGYNQRSQALVDKVGFRQEGVFRERLQRDGKRHDMFLYGILRHEWEELSRQRRDSMTEVG